MYYLQRYKKENFESMIKRFKKINIKNINFSKKEKQKILKNII
ncbi:hypothetical protein [Candidatus Carsonella ruddii]|nr:hypothetical protein [Candidatus Carsonella ruddii]WMC18330.1 MAG: hypothetical protein NU472_00370 [Candidatus Carsonella ruddii]WMC18524.1 MAG: hypothetical protein NU470_00370 [Candidatus Carsonella ruddii]WMC18715.1 MAG: hypothetical protein NU471_00365 [Candidatus Carsonella ruddii]WMC20123.1 MAG: hypothetical protein NVS90_00375 [Candidatus Carsonella ruddii]